MEVFFNSARLKCKTLRGVSGCTTPLQFEHYFSCVTSRARCEGMASRRAAGETRFTTCTVPWWTVLPASRLPGRLYYRRIVDLG